MAIYRIKRKRFGFVDGVLDSVGNTLEGTGKAVKSMSGIGGLVGGVAGLTGSLGVGATAASLGLGPVGAGITALAAPIIGHTLGQTATNVAGDAIKSVGEGIHT